MEKIKDNNVKWIKIYSTPDLQHASFVKGLLKSENIECIIVNKTDSMQLFLKNGTVELYVSEEQLIQAKHILSKAEL